MKRIAVIYYISTFILVTLSFSQEPFDVKAPKEEIDKAYQEMHYPIKVTFKIVDEEGIAVEGADMNVGIDSRLHQDGFNNYGFLHTSFY